MDSTSGYIPKKIENRVSEKYLYTYVHNSIVHYSQMMKVTQVSIDKGMDKQNMTYPHNGILFNLKK